MKMLLLECTTIFFILHCVFHTEARPQELNNEDTTDENVDNTASDKTIIKSRCGRHNVCGTANPSQNCSETAETNSVKVGLETKFGEWPHMCAIKKKRTLNDKTIEEFWAGASLITPGILLTAAHWVSDFTGVPEILTVTCGSHKRPSEEKKEDDLFVRSDKDRQNAIDQPPQVRTVAKIIIHPTFEYKRVWNDVALLFVETDFELTDHINPVCLPTIPTDETEYIQTECTATGWGRNKYDGDYAAKMKQVILPVITKNECNEKFRASRLGSKFTLHKSMLCAGGKQAEDTCKGDGGGPLVCPSKNDPESFIQVGITSWGVGCGKAQLPGVYASIPSSLCFIDWATKCVHGNKYSSEYYDIKTCGSWIEKEMEYLKTLQNGINNKLKDVESTKQSKNNQQKYQELLTDVNDLQSTVTMMENKCNAGEMKFSPLEIGDDGSLAVRKAVVRVAGSIG